MLFYSAYRFRSFPTVRLFTVPAFPLDCKEVSVFEIKFHTGLGHPSSFVDYILQPIAKAQKSYLKDTTDFINFIERTKIPENTTLVSMDVTSLYTNIPQEEGITTVCKAYEAFYNRNIPIPTNSLKEMLQLILGENSFSFNRRNYLQTHGTAMGTKMAVAFANIFMSFSHACKCHLHMVARGHQLWIPCLP